MVTKPDKTRQNDLRTLNPKQAAAVELVAVGKRDTEVAEAVGVTRQTVNAWRKWHPEFEAELNRRRAEVWGASADRLRALLPRALDILEQKLDAPPAESANMALAVVKLSGLATDGLRPAGPTDAEEVIRDHAPTAASLFLADLEHRDVRLAELELAERLADANA